MTTFKVFQTPYSAGLWLFTVTHNGVTHQFAGLANKCWSKRSAIARAAWRAKWLREGTFDQRYK